MSVSRELYVELIQYDELGKRFAKIVCLVVFNYGDFEKCRTLSDLRKAIEEEMGDELFSFLFCKDQECIPVQQEGDTPPLAVMRIQNENNSGKKNCVEYKVNITRDPRSAKRPAYPKPRGNIVSFDARSAFSGTSRSQASTSTTDIKDSGFMMKLDIFAGAFQRYFFQIDMTCTLYCFGPCGSDEFEYEYQNLPRTSAVESFNLIELNRISPYEGSIEKPVRHFAMELLSSSGTKWVLAVPSVSEFAKWVKSFHKTSPKLEPLQYNIVHEKFSWTSEPKGLDLDARSVGGASSKTGTVTRIKTFKVITFSDIQFGMQLSSGIDGTVVHTVAKEGTAYRKGVRVGDLIVSVNDKNVVGLKWRGVKQEILRASRPVRITFGKPNRKPATAATKPGSVSSGLAVKLGPYLYGRKRKQAQQKETQGTHMVSSTMRAANPQFPGQTYSPQQGSNLFNGKGTKPPPQAPPRLPETRRSRLRKTIFGTFKRRNTRNVDENEDNPNFASRAASRQLSRYRGLTISLYEAIEESYKREDAVEGMLMELLDRARKASSSDLMASAPASRFAPVALSSRLMGGRTAESMVVEELQMSLRRGTPRQPPVPIPISNPASPAGFLAASLKQPRTRSIRDEVAVSSRLDSAKMNPSRINRLNSVFQKVQQQSPVQSNPDSASCFGWFKSFCLRKLNRQREKIEALLGMARNGSVEDKEDALDAILDIASTSKNLRMLVDAGIVPVLIDSLRSDDSIVIRENAAGILWNLSDDPEIADAIVSARAIPLLVELVRLESDDERSSDIAKEESAGALWNLTDTFEAKQAILSCKGPKVIVDALKDTKEITDFTKENLAGVVWNLCYDVDCLNAVMKYDPISALARLITKGTVVAQENAAGALMRISLARAYREKIKVCPDAIPALVQLLAFGSILSRENACGALHNIATDDEAIQRLIVEEGAVTPLVRLLQPQFPVNARSRAALCLRTLAQNKDNKQEISQAGGVDLLVKALKEEDALLQIHIVEALWGLAHEDDQNKVRIAQSGAIPKLVAILRNGLSDDARVRAAGALGSLAENKTNSNAIVRSGAVETLVSMVRKGNRASQREAAVALSNLTRGSTLAQKKVMKSLQNGAAIGLSEHERGDIHSIRAKLIELEQVDDEDFIDFFNSQYLDSKAEEDDEDDKHSFFSKKSKSKKF